MTMFLIAAALAAGPVRPETGDTINGTSLSKTAAAAETADAAWTARAERYAAEGKIAGAIALEVSADGVANAWRFGHRDCARTAAMTDDTMFWIASMTKYMTAVAMMTLVEEGKLDLDAPVEKYIPEMRNLRVAGKPGADGKPAAPTKPKRAPTVRMLLTHTAGFRGLAPCQGRNLWVKPLDALAREMAELPLIDEPGRAFHYSTVGIDIAGRVAEVASGLPIDRFLRERLLDPLEMRDTVFHPSAAQYARMAEPTRFDKDARRAVPDGLTREMYALDPARHFPETGGGFFSCARDLANFAQMVAAGGVFKGRRIVSEKSLAETHRDQGCKGQALCCQFTSPTAWSKGGAFRTGFAFDSARGRAFVWLIQDTAAGGANPYGMELRRAAQKALLGGGDIW